MKPVSALTHGQVMHNSASMSRSEETAREASP